MSLPAAMRKVASVIDAVSTWSGKIFSGVMIIVVLVIVYEVIARYGFNAPTEWASELMVYGCALVYLMGGAWALKNGQHLKMELLYSRLSRRGKAWVDAFTYFLFVLYLGFFIWASGKYAWRSWLINESTASSWDPPAYPLKMLMVLGAILVLAQGTAKFMRDAYLAATGREL